MGVPVFCGTFFVAVPEPGVAVAAGLLPVTGHLQLYAFVVFEVCVGIFWPSMMTRRSRNVPEEIRSTLINIFRIPLNLFVCVVLYNVSVFPIYAMFLMCSVFLGICSVAVVQLEKITKPKSGVPSNI